jgi:hypothetical protein
MATQWTAQGITSGAVLPAATLQSIGAPWVDYTPTLTQGVTVTKTITVARYCQLQKTIIVQIALGCTSSGTSGSQVRVGLPIAGTNDRPVGSFLFFGGASHYGNKVGMALTNTTTTAGGFVQDGTSNWFGVSPAFQLLNGDYLYLQLSYEAA